MCVDAHVSGSSGEALVLAVWYVFVGERVNVLLCQAKVNDIDCILVGGSEPSHEEILRLHVAIDEVFTMHVLQSCYLEWERR